MRDDDEYYLCNKLQMPTYKQINWIEQFYRSTLVKTNRITRIEVDYWSSNLICSRLSKNQITSHRSVFVLVDISLVSLLLAFSLFMLQDVRS